MLKLIEDVNNLIEHRNAELKDQRRVPQAEYDAILTRAATAKDEDAKRLMELVIVLDLSPEDVRRDLQRVTGRRIHLSDDQDTLTEL
jgi:hypothetical protein